jgi:LPS sulfotransferase NodH
MGASRHFILTGGRSGSNHLSNSLNKHPAIVNYGEVLGEWTLPYKLQRLLNPAGVTWARFLDALYRRPLPFYMGQAVSALSHLRNGEAVNFKRRRQIRSVGLKDFAFLIHKRGLTSYLADREDIRVIHLQRKNLLDRYLSLVRMDRTGIVKIAGEKPPTGKIVVDLDDMMSVLEQLKLEERQESELVGAINPARLYTVLYEDYFSSNERTQEIIAEILDFLEVPPMPLVSGQKKISPRRLEDAIENYAEVCEALRGGVFEEFLDG